MFGDYTPCKHEMLMFQQQYGENRGEMKLSWKSKGYPLIFIPIDFDNYLSVVHELISICLFFMHQTPNTSTQKKIGG